MIVRVIFDGQFILETGDRLSRSFIGHRFIISKRSSNEKHIHGHFNLQEYYILMTQVRVLEQITTTNQSKVRNYYHL